MPVSQEHRERVFRHLEGQQRLKNIRTKTRLIAAREMRQFMSGEIDILPCSRDRFELEIAREFDRIIKGERP